MNIPWMLLPALLLEAILYFLPLSPVFSKRFQKLNRPLQCGLIWLSGIVPVILVNVLSGDRVPDLTLLAVSLGVVCIWHLVFPPKPISDILLLGLLAFFILGPWFQTLYPTTAAGLKLGALNKLLWLRIGIAIYVFPRKWKVPGFGLWPERRDWIVGIQQFVVFFAILLPLGLYFQILRFQLPKVETWMLPVVTIGTFLGMYLFVAYGEEYFFRGVLQPQLSQSFGGKWYGLIVASLCFGAVHLPYRSFPNWRFAAMAAVAGIFYGKAFERGNSLRAAMIAHALVVTVWTVAFSRSL